MTTATRTPFLIERVDLRADTSETWKLESVEEAAGKFESEVGPSRWPYDEILEELASGGSLAFTDVDEGFEVTARPAEAPDA